MAEQAVEPAVPTPAIQTPPDNLAWWPGTESVLIGPFCINESAKHNVLSVPFHDQEQSPLIEFMDKSGLEEYLMDFLFEYHSSVWQLASTCQKALGISRASIGVWDMTNLFYNGCENEPTPQECEVNAIITSRKRSRKAAKSLHEARISRKGIVRTNLVIAYLRGEARTRMEHSLYESQAWATFQLCQTVKWHGDNFKHVHLHRLPFITVDLLQILVPQMPNLEMLGVYRCPLIHVGDGMRLLSIIRVDRMKGRENQVTLDFYPRLHVGPRVEAGNEYTIGGFGATWENWNAETDRAIYAIVFRFVIQARLQGIDVLGSHCQFRKWLDDGPCWDVDNTLAAMSRAFNFDSIVPGQSPGKFYTEKPRKHHKNGQLIQENELQARFPALTDAIIAIDQRSDYHRGDINAFFEHNEHSRPEGCEWMFLGYKCSSCNTKMPGVFFQYRVIKQYNLNSINGLSCLGCMLSEYLDSEVDHFKNLKHDIMDKWITDGVDSAGWIVKNTNDVGRLLDNFFSRDVLGMAQTLDGIRANFQEKHGFDPETAERQKPVTDQVIRSKRGAFLSAPMIGDWEAEKTRRERAGKDSKVSAYYNDSHARNWMLHSRCYG